MHVLYYGGCCLLLLAGLICTKRHNKIAFLHCVVFFSSRVEAIAIRFLLLLGFISAFRFEDLIAIIDGAKKPIDSGSKEPKATKKRCLCKHYATASTASTASASTLWPLLAFFFLFHCLLSEEAQVIVGRCEISFYTRGSAHEERHLASNRIAILLVPAWCQVITFFNGLKPWT